MAGGIDWFRWHHGSVTDPKFQLVARNSGASLADVLAVWAYLLEHASSSESRGEFGEVDAEAWDCLFNFPEGRTAAILEAMGKRSLVNGGFISSWEKRQPKREREDDTASDRKRRQREREREESAGQQQPDHATQSNVTPSHTTSHQKTPRGEESREEKSNETSNDVSGAASAAKPKRATRKCPDSFELTQDLIDWAFEKYPGVNPVTKFDEFRDHTFKNPISDWAGAFRNWIRKAAEYSSPPARGSPMLNKQEAQEARNRAAADEWLRQEGVMT